MQDDKNRSGKAAGKLAGELLERVHPSGRSAYYENVAFGHR
jgi:hypothetical protein